MTNQAVVLLITAAESIAEGRGSLVWRPDALGQRRKAPDVVVDLVDLVVLLGVGGWRHAVLVAAVTVSRYAVLVMVVVMVSAVTVPVMTRRVRAVRTRRAP